MNRSLELALALVLLLVAAPVIAAAAAWVQLGSPGPALFAQKRVGRDEKLFSCFKLRTMHHGTETLPTHEVGNGAVTRAGEVLRRLKIDELPQLWNVVKGEMSLVGPRPCLPGQAAMIEPRRKLGVFSLRPGITGLAQVRGVDMSDPELCVATDAEYMRRRSLALDARILIGTLFGRSVE